MPTQQQQQRAVIAGQGHVGLPLAKALTNAGWSVVGFDINQNRVEQLNSAALPNGGRDLALSYMLQNGRYYATSNPTDLGGWNVAVIAVPTPLRNGLPDLTAVLAAAADLSAHLIPGCLVVLESTVAPGTTTGPLADALRTNSTLEPGVDYHLGYSPERFDPGNPVWDLGNTPKLVSATTPAGLDNALGFYRSICEQVVTVTRPDVAELAKIVENTYRQVNIALVNELGRHAHRLGIDFREVLDAAATKPFGFTRFSPGPGVGGHCLPIDPVYFSHQVEQLTGRPIDIIDLAMRVNADQPRYVVDRAAELLNTHKLAVNGARILILGLSYKQGTGDIREAPAAQIVAQLLDRGAEVSVCDPHVPHAAGEFPPQVKHTDPGDVLDAAAGADLTILVTDHHEFPYDQIARAAGPILDTRGRFTPNTPNVHFL